LNTSRQTIVNYIPGVEPALKESDILKQVKDYLRWNGWFVIRIQQGLGSYRGISDLIAIKDGKVVFVEIKTKKGNLSEWQIKFKNDLEAKGGTYVVIRSIDDIKGTL
jgi:Holliday junction resolvase